MPSKRFWAKNNPYKDFIETVEKRQGLKVGCLEEIAFEKGFITIEQLMNQAKTLKGTSYGDYLINRYG